MTAARLTVGLTNHQNRLSMDQLATNKHGELDCGCVCVDLNLVCVYVCTRVHVHIDTTETLLRSACRMEEGLNVKRSGTVIYFQSVHLKCV